MATQDLDDAHTKVRTAISGTRPLRPCARPGCANLAKFRFCSQRCRYAKAAALRSRQCVSCGLDISDRHRRAIRCVSCADSSAKSARREWRILSETVGVYEPEAEVDRMVAAALAEVRRHRRHETTELPPLLGSSLAGFRRV